MKDLAKEYLEFVNDMVDMHGESNCYGEYLPVVEDELDYWVECHVDDEDAFWKAVRTAKAS